MQYYMSRLFIKHCGCRDQFG